MQITVENTTDVRRKVRLVVPAGEVSKVYKAVLAKVGGRARIKGFRPGKAPRKLLERRFGPVIREEVLERVLSKSIPKALDDQKLEPMGQPELDEIGELRDGEDLSLAFSVEVLPELSFEGWQGAELTVPTCTADDQDLQAALDQVADQHASIDDADSPSQDGDQVQVRYAVGAEGEPNERRFVVGGGGYEEWVNGAITGKSTGDTFEVPEYEKTDENDARPDADTVKGEILEVKRRNVPAIDDELAKKDGRFETLEELKADLTASQQKQAERRTIDWKRDAALDHLLVSHPFDVPRALVEREVDRRLSRTFGPQALDRNGQLYGLLQEMRGTMRAEARDQVRRALIVRHLIDSGNFEITDEEIDAHIEKIITEMKDLPDTAITQLKSAEGREQARDVLQQDKALDGLLAELTITAGETLALRDPAPERKTAETGDEGEEAHDHDHGPAHGEEGHVHGPNCNHDH